MFALKTFAGMLVLLTSGIVAAQVRSAIPKVADPPCKAILKIEYADYPSGDKDAKIDIVTVCDNGRVLATHSFPEPSFGQSADQRATWNYQGKFSSAELSDLKKVLTRPDIVQLSAQPLITVEQGQSALDRTIKFSILDRENLQTINIRGPLYLTCGPEDKNFLPSIRDLLCLFGDLSAAARNKPISTAEDCGCSPLHEMTEATHVAKH